MRPCELEMRSRLLWFFFGSFANAPAKLSHIRINHQVSGNLLCNWQPHSWNPRCAPRNANFFAAIILGYFESVSASINLGVSVRLKFG
jgi:hypothetical protein